MSRIFEALQRSESERTGFSFPEPPELATELLQQAEKEQEQTSVEVGDWPTLGVRVAPGSRLVALSDKDSLGAEKFRFLSVRLRQRQQEQREKPLKRVLVTSTLPEEGKSLVSANLAATLARRKQQKVLLLDGDLRRPMQAQLFGGTQVAGISEWLQASKREIGNLYFLEEPGFWLMPAGRPPENPLELMQSGRLGELMDQLAGWFDWVIIDSPPVLPLADTSVWARVADGILLVVREGRTEKRQLKRGLAALDQSRLLGVVVNSASDSDHEDYYSRYSTPAESEPKAESKNKK
jgi:capsular exopolysaccharide synthesis family protein